MFDDIDRRISIILCDSTAEEFVYDKNDNVIENKDNNGLKRLYKFDDLDRMFRMDLDLSELTPGTHFEHPGDFEEYVYDGLKRKVGYTYRGSSRLRTRHFSDHSGTLQKMNQRISL
jgi:YD repeat-containing protein